MNLSELAKRAQKFAVDNSPAIFTAIGVTGVITSALLTARGTKLYMQELAEEGYYDRDYKFEREPKEHLQRAWKFYIPAAGTSVLTIAAIVYANRVGNRRAAALAAAYSLTEKAFDEYKHKVVERLGSDKERNLRDEIAQDRVNKKPVDTKEVIVTGNGQVLCHEAFTGRYFQSDMETLRKAQNDINKQVINDSYASLSDFYDLLGLPHTDNSSEVGWNTDKLLELQFSATLTKYNVPCISMSFSVSPIRDYFRLS